MEAKRKREDEFAGGGGGGGKVVLGYWAIRGLGQPIRLLLEYSGTPYEEKLYHAVWKECGATKVKKIDREEWFGVKYELGLDFPNLPWLKDGDLKLTQTGAILTYLAEKVGMNGKSAEERAKIAMLYGLSQDVRSRYTRAAYSPDFESMKQDLVVFLEEKLKDLDAYLKGSTSGYLVGDGVTYIDLLWYDLLDQFKLVKKEVSEVDILKNFSCLETFYMKIHNHPSIEKYRNSSAFIQQLNNTQATFK